MSTKPKPFWRSQLLARHAFRIRRLRSGQPSLAFALGVMSTSSYFLVAALVLPLTGCSHTEPDKTESGAIVVYVGGGINKGGKYALSPPFTVEHAIQLAGGLEEFERDLNRKVMIQHDGRRKIFVPRKHYSSFKLTDGDAVVVPRH